MTRTLRAAVLLVVLANALLAWRAISNRNGTDATVTLTETELPLVSGDAENTAFAVELHWDSPRDVPLSPETAAALGFDTDVVQALRAGTPLPRNVMPRRGWAVLEHGTAGPGPDQSALRLVDAGSDAAALRGRHPDRTRHLVVRAEARVMFLRTPSSGPATGPPQLVLRVASVVPGVIAVPRDLRHVFEGLPTAAEAHPPRYRATIRYGRNHEPWMVAASRLP